MLWLTGLFFLTNAVHAYHRGYWLYAAAFTALAATSYVWHSNTSEDPTERKLKHALDQLALWCVILLGAYYWQQIPETTLERWVPLVAVTATGVIWYGGSLTESFTHSNDPMYRIPAHGILHTISSIGHHAIIALMP